MTPRPTRSCPSGRSRCCRCPSLGSASGGRRRALYLWQRWPHAVTGRTPTDPTVVSATWAVHRTVANLAAAASVALGLPQIYWALGGTIGLDQAALDHRDAQWHILTGNSGVWALIAAWGVWTVLRRSASASLRTPMLLTWVASGAVRLGIMEGDLHLRGDVVVSVAGASVGTGGAEPRQRARRALLLVVLLLVAAHRHTPAVSAEVGSR
ncbi:hypothetical protein NKG94_09165 [Micromonospora sp. M12]